MRLTYQTHRLLALAAGLLLTAIVHAAPDPVISYQGQLNESGQAATGSFDLQFKLFDALTGGLQIGPTVVKNGASVVDGIFSVELNFGVGAFDGAQRFIEVAVREAGVGSFITLTPRQKVIATAVAQFSTTSAQSSCDCPFTVSGSTVTISGTVGVGTSATESPLHVLEGSAGVITAHANASLTLERSGNNYLNMLTPDTDESGVLFGNPGAGSTAGGIIFNAGSALDGLQFRTGGSQTRMTIDGTGKIGIGTSAPLEALHVRTATGSPLTTVLITPGTTESDSQIKMTEDNSGTLGSIMRVDGATNSWQLIGLTSVGEGSPNMVVNRDTGNVGIGTSAPATNLHVHRIGAGHNIMRVQSFSGHARLALLSDSTGEAVVYSPHDTNDLRFELNSLDRIAITDAGNVGIGTTAPAARLQVAGLIHSTNGGIRFPDGTIQTTTGSVGPIGDQGPPGPPGPTAPPTTSIAICANQLADCDDLCVVASLVVEDVTEPEGCTVTSATGSCTSLDTPGLETCCVCRVP